MWWLALAVAQQGLLGSPQYAHFGQGQCPIARANAGDGQLAARHTHNGACTAGMGINHFMIGNDEFITRHQDYIVAFRNGSCISSAPEDTTCDELHLYRRERTPFLVILEAFWRRSNGTAFRLGTKFHTPLCRRWTELVGALQPQWTLGQGKIFKRCR